MAEPRRLSLYLCKTLRVSPTPGLSSLLFITLSCIIVSAPQIAAHLDTATQNLPNFAKPSHSTTGSYQQCLKPNNRLDSCNITIYNGCTTVVQQSVLDHHNLLPTGLKPTTVTLDIKVGCICLVSEKVCL